MSYQNLQVKIMLCPCGKAFSYDQCCGKYIDGIILPEDPETLMRSRYTAFTLSKIEYLAHTMLGKALKKFNFHGLEDWLKIVKWQSLTVIKTELKTPTQGFVTFEARYLERETPSIIREKSEFKKMDGKWFYVDGNSLPTNNK